MAKNELAIIENPVESLYLPSNDEIKEVVDDLSDIMSHKVFGVISIAPAGAGTFDILEPGAEEKTKGVQEVECIILASHPMNVRWEHDYSSREPGEHPACRSLDAVEGIDADGALHDCATCEYNQFGENGERKICANKRQLYVMRQGDVLPMLLTLSPSALKAYDNYRIRARLQLKASMYALVTRITLNVKKSEAARAEYSVPVFTPIATLPKAEAQRVEAFARSIVDSARRAGIVADEISADSDGSEQAPTPGTFVEVADEDLPENF